MAPRLFLALIALIGVMWYLSWYNKADKDQRNKSMISVLLYGSAAALLILVVTGRIPWLFAMLSAATPWINKALTMKSMWQRFNGSKPTEPPPAGPISAVEMTSEEALEVLGLEKGATDSEISLAHKKLIQKIHPDKGGSGYLASQINKAKETLLKT
jgi:DnaJ family protein C protein 19